MNCIGDLQKNYLWGTSVQASSPTKQETKPTRPSSTSQKQRLHNKRSLYRQVVEDSDDNQHTKTHFKAYKAPDSWSKANMDVNPNRDRFCKSVLTSTGLNPQSGHIVPRHNKNNTSTPPPRIRAKERTIMKPEKSFQADHPVLQVQANPLKSRKSNKAVRPNVPKKPVTQNTLDLYKKGVFEQTNYNAEGSRSPRRGLKTENDIEINLATQEEEELISKRKYFTSRLRAPQRDENKFFNYTEAKQKIVEEYRAANPLDNSNLFEHSDYRQKRKIAESHHRAKTPTKSRSNSREYSMADRIRSSSGIFQKNAAEKARKEELENPYKVNNIHVKRRQNGDLAGRVTKAQSRILSTLSGDNITYPPGSKHHSTQHTQTNRLTLQATSQRRSVSPITALAE